MNSVDSSTLDEPARLRLGQALARAVRGDVEFGTGTRAAYATDSSNYRQVPLGVVFPRDHDDAVAALRVCSEHDAPVLGRGAGTSLAGQACNAAVAVDTSRYMTRVREIDPDRRLARVEPGVVLDDLRRAAEAHGLTFGPDPATHAWCTVGGVIGNNACGTHSLYAGKAVDNVERLVLATYGGDVLDVGAYDDSSYAAIGPRDGAIAPILGGLRELARRYGDLVRERYPDIPRRVSGFNLDQLLPENGFHVARALAGTESTCGLVTEATVRLCHSPGHRRLVALGYPDIIAAAEAVPSLVKHPLLGLEGLDQALVDRMRALGLNTRHLGLLPEGRGWLLAELGADGADEADELTDAFVAALPSGVTWRRYDEPGQQRRVWMIRESGLGAATVAGPRHHFVEGWEDAAVPPERLATYLRGMIELWAEYGYSGVWYGHFGQGCVHTRNNFDLHTEEGLRAYRSFVERAADLVVSLGGSLSGEHGDGQARGELLERMFGPELVDAFRQFKAIFDPRGRMNPGKVVDPYPLDSNIRYGPSYPATTSLTTESFALPRDAGSLQIAAERCVGVGSCRRDDAGTMCPSYRVTRDERHSTRGRARLLAEMFQGEVTPRTWRNTDVREALDLCLSCKGCAVDCPTGVDMATYKAEFLSHHYAGRLRPRAMYALGLIPWAARVATRMPRIANLILSAPGAGTAARRLAGVTTRRPAPSFAAAPWRRSAGAAARPGAAAPAAVSRAGTSEATVVVWPDTFTDAFRPAVGDDLVAVLEALGEEVAVPAAWACCGRPLYDMGMLALARRTLRRLLDVLEPWTSHGVPVVVPEPSCLAAFRDELPGLLPDDPRAAALAALARSPAEHVLATGRLGAALAATPAATSASGRIVVHPHCQHRAVGGPPADRELLERLGYQVEMLDAGCCGMAGSFGFRAEHEDVSRRIGEETWLPAVRAALTGQRGSSLVVDGFSCETQLAHLSELRSSSLVTLARRRLGA